jgi:hypothetical protein
MKGRMLSISYLTSRYDIRFEVMINDSTQRSKQYSEQMND